MKKANEWVSLVLLCQHWSPLWNAQKSKTRQERKSLFPLLPLPEFPKVIHSLPSPSLSCSLSSAPFTIWSPSRSLCFPNPQPPAPCFSRLSSALAAFCGSLPEALLWTDSALRAKNCPPMWRGIRGGGAQSQSQEGAEAICVLVGQPGYHLRSHQQL